VSKEDKLRGVSDKKDQKVPNIEVCDGDYLCDETSELSQQKQPKFIRARNYPGKAA